VTPLQIGLAAALTCAVLWAVLDVLRKQLSSRMDMVGLAVWLAVGQAPALALWVAQSPPGVIAPLYWPWAVASVVFNIVAAVLYLYAIASSQFSVAIPMLAFVPVFTSLIGIPLLGQVPTWFQTAGIAAVMLGAMILHGAGRRGLVQVTTMLREPASAAMLGVALCWAMTIVLDRRATLHAPLPVHALVLSFGTALGATVWLAVRGRLGELQQARRAPVRLVVAALVAAAAMGFQLFAIQDIDVAVIEAVKRTVGMVAALALGRAVFGEPLTSRKLVAVAMMAAGTVLVIADLR